MFTKGLKDFFMFNSEESDSSDSQVLYHTGDSGDEGKFSLYHTGESDDVFYSRIVDFVFLSFTTSITL